MNELINSAEKYLELQIYDRQSHGDYITELEQPKDESGSRLPERVLPSEFSSKRVLEALSANQDGDAGLLKELHKNMLCFDHSGQRWYRRTGDSHWQEDKIRAAMTSINSVVKIYSIEQRRQNNRRLNLAQQGNANPIETERIEKNIDALLKRINALQARKRKEDVLFLAGAGENSLGISGEEWDANPWMLGVKNGIIDFKTGELRPIDPLAYIKTVAPTAYHGSDTLAPTWEKFLSEIFNDDQSLVGFIQRLTGYAMIAHSSILYARPFTMPMRLPVAGKLPSINSVKCLPGFSSDWQMSPGYQ